MWDSGDGDVEQALAGLLGALDGNHDLLSSLALECPGTPALEPSQYSPALSVDAPSPQTDAVSMQPCPHAPTATSFASLASPTWPGIQHLGGDSFGQAAAIGTKVNMAAPFGLSVQPGKSYGSKHKSNPNKARTAEVQQIQHLRREAERLEEQRDMLKAVSLRSTGTTIASGNLKSPQVWEEICQNQRAHRTEAEKANSLLKRALGEQAQLLDRLQRALQRSSNIQKGIDACCISSRRAFVTPSITDADERIFDMLCGEADAAYYEAEGIFALNGIDGPFVKTQRGCSIREREHGRFADMFSSSAMPFSLAATADAVWRFYSGPSKHRGPLYYKTARTLDNCEGTIAEKLAIELVANGARADFRVWQVVRRFVSADRVLVVWMGILEPIEFANQPFSSYAFREKGYVSCSRLRSSAMLTHLQRCHRIMPYTTSPSSHSALSEQEASEIGAVIAFVLGLDSITAHLEALENELLNQPRGQLSHEQAQ